MAVEPLDSDIAAAIAALCDVYLRPPAGVTGYPGPARTLVFDPPLTNGEVTTYDTIVRMARSHITGLTLAEYQALASDLAVLRTFRHQSQSEFMALTAAQRDRALFDVVNAQTNVLRALLRD